MAGPGPVNDPLQNAVEALLRRIPKRWSRYDCDALTATETQALSLLVSAGMVERRIRFRLQLHNHPVAVNATITATGLQGLAEAMRPVLASMWVDWADAFRAWQTGDARGAPPAVAERLDPDKWRLTDQGELALTDLDAGHSTRVLDFVLQRGFFDGAPRLNPETGGVSRREQVRGSGRLVTMRKVQVEAVSPMAVEIRNWREGADAFASVFGTALDAADGHEREDTAAHAAPPAAPGQAKRRRRSTLKVNEQAELAILDGVEYRLRGGHAVTFVKILHDARGQRVTATYLQKLGIRADREYARLPEALQDLIDKPGRGQKGYRLSLRRTP